MSYTSETAALLPLLIQQAGADQDYAPLMANALFFTERINGSIALGMNAAVLCTEDVPFYKTDAATQQAIADTYVGAMPVTQLIETCKHWPRGIIAADFKQPVVSDKPVLLISGQDDPITRHRTRPTPRARSRTACPSWCRARATAMPTAAVCRD